MKGDSKILSRCIFPLCRTFNAVSVLISVFQLYTATCCAAMDTAFRKIDIDAYDEDTLLETELYEADPREPAQVLAEAKQKQVAVRSSLAK